MARNREESSSTSSFKGVRAGLAVAACLLLLEAGFRLHYFGVEALLHPVAYNPVGFLRTGFVEVDPDPAVAWRIRPSATGVFKGARFSSNEHGLRSPPVGKEKPPGEYRIAVLGASVTMGSGVDDEEVYARRLQALLDRDYPGRFRVINFAVGGYELNQIIAAYERVVKPFSPDIVLLPMTVRAFLERTKTVQWPLSFAWFEPTELRSYMEHFFISLALRKWFSEFAGAHLSTDWRKLAPAAEESKFSTIDYESVKTTELLLPFLEKRSAEDVDVVITLLKSPWDLPEPYRRAALHVVRKELENVDRVSLIDTAEHIARDITLADTVYYGEKHPDATVHEEFARAIYQGLLPLLNRELDGR